MTMDAIQAARELGKAIQGDERYLRILRAQETNDKDAALQAKIQEFSEKRAQLNTEVKKESKDADLIKALDLEVKELYGEIFENPGMKEFAEARTGFQDMLAFINQIINSSASGEDPDLVEFDAACGGDCAGCNHCG